MIALSAVLEIFCFQSFGTLLEGEVTANNFFCSTPFPVFPLLFDIGEPAKARCPGGDGRRANFYDPGFQHCKGHRIVRIPRDKPQKPFWVCATCGRLWARLRFLIIDVQAGLLDECEGEGARESWLRGRSFKLIWAKLSAASRKRLSACISVSRSERRMLASGAHKLRKERGPTDVRHTQASWASDAIDAKVVWGSLCR